MNLLFITPGFVYPLMGGQSIRTYHMLKELHAMGVRITAITIREPGSDGTFLDAMRGFCHEVIPVSFDPDRTRSFVERALLKISSTPSTMLRYNHPAIAAAVSSALRRDKYDAVFCDQLHMASYCYDIPLPKILNTDDPLYLQLEREARITSALLEKIKFRWEASKYKRYERKMFNAFDAVLFVSAADREQVQLDLGVQNIEIVPQGVDTAIYDPQGPGWADAPAEPYVLISGMMNYAPNALSAIYFVEQVLPLVRKQRPETVCVIVGAYPTDEVKALGRNHAGVIVTGFVDDVLPYMRSAAVYVAPAISGTGIKNKVLQAMAMEKGIVATQLSMDGIPQAKHGEQVLIANSPEGLASETLRLLVDRTLCRRLGKAAFACIREHYSWQCIVSNLYEILTDKINC